MLWYAFQSETSEPWVTTLTICAVTRVSPHRMRGPPRRRRLVCWCYPIRFFRACIWKLEVTKGYHSSRSIVGGPRFMRMQHESSNQERAYRQSPQIYSQGVPSRLSTRSLMTQSEKASPQAHFSSLPVARKSVPGSQTTSWSSHSSWSSSSLGSDGMARASPPSALTRNTKSAASSWTGPIPRDAIVTQTPGSSYRTYTWKVTQPNGYTTTHWYSGPLGPDRIPPKFDDSLSLPVSFEMFMPNMWSNWFFFLEFLGSGIAAAFWVVDS